MLILAISRRRKAVTCIREQAQHAQIGPHVLLLSITFYRPSALGKDLL